jgi:hypothetical protein
MFEPEDTSNDRHGESRHGGPGFWRGIHSDPPKPPAGEHCRDLPPQRGGTEQGGSHPHLVHEFVSALVEDRDLWPNAVQSANWTCVGICAHQSTMQGGAVVKLPEFTLG